MRATAVALALALAGCHAPHPATPSLAAVPEYAKVELELAPGTEAATFVGPDGRALIVPSFTDGDRTLVRFAARAPGRWRWTAGRRAGEFDAVAAPGHGDVRRDPRAPHRLVFADGKPFFPLGENRFNVYDPTWNYENASIEDYLSRMGAAGENTIRLFVICDCDDEARADHLQPGCLEPAPRHFDEAAARRYDRIVDAAERDGVYVIFGVWAIGFSLDDQWKGWGDNPYSRLGTRDQFFVDESIRRVAAGKLRYIAARWGWSTHLLAVDLLNEPEWDGRIPESQWIPWAKKMARAWRDDDPYGHLVTAGPVGLRYNVDGSDAPWYGAPENDIVQWHLYGKEYYEVHALADQMTRETRQVWGFDKPVLVGEFAYGGEDKSTYDHTHVGIWSATFSGAGVLMHSAPPFSVDSDEPMTPERAHHARVLADFLAALPDVPLAPGPAAADHGVRGWSLRGPGVVALWLLAPANGYGERVDGARVTLDGVDGDWQVRFVDDVTGGVVGRGRAHAEPGQALTLPLPSFSRHLAVRMVRM